MELRKRLYIVVVLLAVIIVGLLLMMWLAGNSQTGFTNPTQSPPRLDQSVGDAAKVLQTWIDGNWVADGSIVACTLTMSKRDPAISNWTFQVYSKEKNRILVAVVQNQNVKMLRDITPLYPQTVLPTTAWKQDSHDILNTWWRSGGAAAWTKSEADSLAIRLGMREDRIPSWKLTLSTKD